MPVHICPGCGTGMAAGRMGPIELDLCFPCGGVWFDDGELPQLVSAGAAVVRRLHERLRPAAAGVTTRDTGGSGGSRGRCPHCQVPLSAIASGALPGVPLQSCSFCRGVWIGSDALSRVADLLDPPPVPTHLAAPSPSVPSPSGPLIPPPSATLPDVFGPAPPASATPAPVSQFAVPPAPPAPPQPAAPSLPIAGFGGRHAGPVRSGPREPVHPAGPAKPHSTVGAEACPGCGERNPPDAAVCWACGKVLMGTVSGTCPRCEGTLRQLDSKGVKVESCDGCGGVWLEEGRLGALEMQSPDLQEALLTRIHRNRTGKIHKLNQGMLCPHCNLVLFRAQMMLSSEPVDHCPGCSGTFLDDGVLDSMLRDSRSTIKSSRR